MLVLLLGKCLTAQNHIVQFIKHMPVTELINHEMHVCIACTVHVCVFHYTALDEQVYLYLMTLIFLFDLLNVPACILS